jgi:hypothetical protein
MCPAYIWDRRPKLRRAIEIAGHAKKQKPFGESRLARFGVGDNRKGPPRCNRIKIIHAAAGL